MTPPRILSPAETATRLRVSRTTVYALVRTGELEMIHIRDRVYIPVTSIDGYLTRLIGAATQRAEQLRRLRREEVAQ